MKVKRIKKVAIFILICFMIVFGLIYFDNNTLQISDYNISSTKLDKAFDGFKILQLSDLHSKQFGNDNRKLIRRINDEKPDIIVMTGDMINTSDDNFNVFLELSKNLVQKYELYYIVGNHEQIINSHRLIQNLKNIGVKVLDSERIKIERGNSFINLYGMWFSVKYYKNANNLEEQNINYDLATMQKAIGVSDPSEYNILLTHNPLYYSTYSQWGADLTLSGHVHGGIIRLPFYKGLLSPERTWFPEYDAGQFNSGKSIMIVNRGLGNEVIIPRVLNRPEITVMTLKVTN
jgi:predicted MPP superfamily phosphohydrolase